jgi:hypothetical protein
VAVARDLVEIPIPALASEDYAEFRRICIGLPPTHEEWCTNQRQWHQNDLAAGRKVVTIPVVPADGIGLADQRMSERQHCPQKGLT